MRPKITNEKKRLVRSMIKQGYGNKEIEKEMDYTVSVSTIKRIKNEMPSQGEAPQDITNQYQYNAKLTKKEEKFTQKIKDEIDLFEDKVEGWVYHLTKEKKDRQQNSRWYSFLVYPESAPEGWIDNLRATGLEAAVSPLHDKDKREHDSEEQEVVDTETGEIKIFKKGEKYLKNDEKKHHWHGIVKFEKMTRYDEANELIRSITNGPYVQKCLSLKGAYEYFIHLNNQDRYQYEKEEIIKLNGFKVEPTETEKKEMFNEIIKIVIEKEMTESTDIYKHYEDQVEYINIIGQKSYAIKTLITDNWRREQRQKDIAKLNMAIKYIVDGEKDQESEKAFKEIVEEELQVKAKKNKKRGN